MKRLTYFPAVTLANISLMAILTCPCRCQQGNAEAPHHSDDCSTTIEDGSNLVTRLRATRTIEDPGTHQHWVLLENLSRPAAPGLLVLRPRDFSCARLGAERLRSSSDTQSVPIPVIHAGDKLILSEHTSAIDADLEAMALTSAAIGKGLTVRLKFGSRTVSAIATAPGRASFAEGRTEVYR